MDVSIKIEISVGELLDKITILEIKTERIKDAKKLININKELEVLNSHWSKSSFTNNSLDNEINALKKVNEQLWEIEDAIRGKEKEQAFDKEFVELARSIYFANDKRANIKHTINSKTGSDLIEEKSYSEYSSTNS